MLNGLNDSQYFRLSAENRKLEPYVILDSGLERGEYKQGKNWIRSNIGTK